jgi:hypothetical protein
MHSFRLVPASEGPRREFKITLGLRAGYGSAGRIYRLEEAIRTAHRWMRERAARGAPFLSGMVTRGEVLYADSGGDAPSHREPVAIFTERFSRNTPAILMMARSGSCSTNWQPKWASASNRRRCILHIGIGHGR